MASSVIGALRVNLGIDTAAFSSGLKSAESSLAKFGSAMKVGLLAASTAGVAAMGALAVGIKKTIDTADEMSKAAQKFGIPIDELSRLKWAADLSGVSLETLGKGVQRLSRNMVDAEMGLQAPKRAFDALGISITNADGTLKISSQVMTEVAGRFASMKDGVEKTALAMTLFGRAGAELIPMFNAGADGLASMMAEADALGITLDSNTGRAAENFNDNLSRLGKTKDALYLKISSKLLPSLELLSEKFIDVANNGEMIEVMSSGLVKALSFISNEVAQLAILSNRLSAEFAGVAEAFTRLKSGDFSGAWSAFQEGQNASAEMAAQMKADVEGIFDGSTVSDAYIQRRLDDAFGVAGASAGEKFVVNFETATKSGGGRVRTALNPMVAEAARIFEATRTPLEAYQAAIARLNELLSAGAINQDTYNRAVVQAQDAFSQAEEAGKKTKGVMEGIGDSISQTFTSAFEGLIDGSKKVGDVLKDLLKQFASMAMNSVFKSLLGGFGGGGGIFGAIGGLFGFASGGTIMPGGAGGIDSQLVAFRKSPNERVDITKPGQTLNSGGGQITDVRVYVDDNGNWDAKVERISQKQIGRAAPAIVEQSKAQILPTVADYQGNRSGSDFRVA